MRVSTTRVGFWAASFPAAPVAGMAPKAGFPRKRAWVPNATWKAYIIATLKAHGVAFDPM